MINRLPRPAKTRSRSRDNSRQVVVVIAIGLTLALGALISGGYVAGAKRQTAAAAAAANDDDIYTGSILYMAYDGSSCRQLLFDNQNGRITDNGYVDCERAAYHGLDGPKRWSADRIRVIRTGFRGD